MARKMESKQDVVKDEEAEKILGVYVQAVYGDMWHCDYNLMIKSRTLVPKIDSFLQSQIDAGKLKICQ